MPKLTIYHNNRCSKSRETLALVENSGREFQVVEYLSSPPSTAELDRLLIQLGLSPIDIVRKKEGRYAELGLEANPPPTRAAWLEVLVKNPVLIERPIVTDGRRAVIGRPPENVRVLLDR